MNRLRSASWRVSMGVALMVAVLSFLVAGSLGEARHNALVMEQLHQIEEFEANLSENVLKLRFGLVNNYDGLNESLARMRRARASLESGEAAITGQGHPGIDHAFKAFDDAQNAYEELVEQFKSSNSQLKNSMHHFPAAVVEVRHELPQDSQGRALDDDLADLFYNVLHYGTGGDEKLAGLIAARIAEIRGVLGAQQPALRQKIQNVLDHASLILKQRPFLDELTARIVFPLLRQHLDKLSSSFQALVTLRDQRADAYRLTLGILSALFFVVAAAALIRLLQNARQIKRDHHFLECISDSIGEGVIATDKQGAVIFANREAVRLTGWDKARLFGRDMHDTFHANADGSRHSREQCEMVRCQAQGNICRSEEQYFVREDGSTFPVALVNVPIVDEGELGAVIVFRDITLAREKERDLRLAASVFEHSPYAITVTDPGAVILRVNPAFCEITGYAESDVVGVNPRVLQSGLHDRSFYQNFWHTLLETGQWKGELRNRRKNGDIFPEWLNIRAVKDDSNTLTHYVGIFTDLSEHEEAERRLDYLSNYDVLTGLPNRVLLQDRLDRAVARAQRGEQALAILFLDLDRFKLINDSLGHAAGDLLLKGAAGRLRECLRESDTLSRISGDQFAILFENIVNVADVAVKAEELLQVFLKPFDIFDHEIFSTVSIGITLCPHDGTDPGTLLTNADAAMFRAKEKGRNNFQFFSADMTAGVFETLRMENALRRALENHELELLYQPQFDLLKRRVIGVEALLRWHSKDFGLVPPARFIPMAEKNGLIVPIGEWVLRTACAQAKAWQLGGMPPFKIAVNLSAVQFRQSDLAGKIREVLVETGLEAAFLELEITESVVMEDVERTIGTLVQLKDLGCEISVDDFGTGYSSLSYLKRFPVDALKIDQSFVQGLGTDPDDTAVVNAVISLGESLALKLVAEGVETLQQLECLEARPGNAQISVQGFYFSEPITAGELVAYCSGCDMPGAE